jgi:hypothetical protein
MSNCNNIMSTGCLPCQSLPVSHLAMINEWAQRLTDQHEQLNSMIEFHRQVIL